MFVLGNLEGVPMFHNSMAFHRATVQLQHLHHLRAAVGVKQQPAVAVSVPFQFGLPVRRQHAPIVHEITILVILVCVLHALHFPWSTNMTRASNGLICERRRLIVGAGAAVRHEDRRLMQHRYKTRGICRTIMNRCSDLKEHTDFRELPALAVTRK